MLYCIICQTESNGFRHGLLCISIYKYDIISVDSITFMCLLLYGRHLSDENIAENETMICSAAWWNQCNLTHFKSSFLVLFCFLYGVTYKPSRAGQNCYTWCCHPQWMYLQVTIIKKYLPIHLTVHAWEPVSKCGMNVVFSCLLEVDYLYCHS